jgi:hypothetical protein
VEQESKKPVTMSNLQLAQPAPRSRNRFLSPNHSLMIPAKATPSVQRAYLSLPPVPCIDERLLQPMELGDNFIGMGSFGSCAQLTYKDVFTVCVKRLKKDVPLRAVKSEAAILFCLRSTPVNTHHTVLEFVQHNMQLSWAVYNRWSGLTGLEGWTGPVDCQGLTYSLCARIYTCYVLCLFSPHKTRIMHAQAHFVPYV